jgi:hypothetical protein
MVNRKTSREIVDAHVELQRRWKWVLDEYRILYPKRPLPQISCTYRDMIDQNAAKARGASEVSFPNSTHNIYPSWALDFFFTERDANGKAFTSYREPWVTDVCNIVKRAGLFSGIDWDWDKPHVALVKYASQAGPNALVALPPLPLHSEDNNWKLVVVDQPEDGEDILIRVSPKKKRVYLRGDKG